LLSLAWSTDLFHEKAVLLNLIRKLHYSKLQLLGGPTLKRNACIQVSLEFDSVNAVDIRYTNEYLEVL